MSETIPIFASDFSLGRSILTLEEPEDKINLEFPISIFTIAKQHNLQNLFLVDTSFGGFWKAYQNAAKINVSLSFGFKVSVCSKMSDKDDASTKTESKVIIWMKNSEGYKDAIRLYSRSFLEGFYYHNRLDWTALKDGWTNNLLLSIPFYDSFLHNNLLKYDNNIVPDFGNIKPNVLLESHDLPFDDLINGAAIKYAENNGLELQNSHSVYYYNKSLFKSYVVMRAINNRTTYAVPNLDHFSSDQFNFEDFLKI